MPSDFWKGFWNRAEKSHPTSSRLIYCQLIYCCRQEERRTNSGEPMHHVHPQALPLSFSPQSWSQHHTGARSCCLSLYQKKQALGQEKESHPLGPQPQRSPPCGHAPCNLSLVEERTRWPAKGAAVNYSLCCHDD